MRRLFGRYLSDPARCPRSGGPSRTADDNGSARRVADFLAGMTDRYALSRISAGLFDEQAPIWVRPRRTCDPTAAEALRAMNIFQDFTKPRSRTLVQPIVAERAVRPSRRPRPHRRRAAARRRATATSPPMRRWCWPSRSALKPRELATRIAAALARDPDVDAAEVAGPGLHQPPAASRPTGSGPCAASDRRPATATADGDAARASKVNVEYVSANPTGPMHVGHCRGAVFGDALATLLAVRRLRRHPRVLHQRRRRAGRRRSPARPILRYREALGEDDRRDPGGALSRRLPEAGRRGAGREHGDRLLAACTRRNGCRSSARRRSTR